MNSLIMLRILHVVASSIFMEVVVEFINDFIYLIMLNKTAFLLKHCIAGGGQAHRPGLGKGVKLNFMS